jgi:hypothetical protein
MSFIASGLLCWSRSTGCHYDFRYFKKSGVEKDGLQFGQYAPWPFPSAPQKGRTSRLLSRAEPLVKV